LTKNLKGQEAAVWSGRLSSLSEEKKEQLLTGFELVAWHDGQLVKNLEGQMTALQNGCLTSLSDDKKQQMLTGFRNASLFTARATLTVGSPQSLRG